MAAFFAAPSQRRHDAEMKETTNVERSRLTAAITSRQFIMGQKPGREIPGWTPSRST